MKSANMQEFIALSSAHGPNFTSLEIQTKVLLDEREELYRKIRETKVEVKKQRIESLLKQISPVTNLESRRAAIWGKATLAQRRIACMCAGINRMRADDALIDFDAFERTKIWTALDDLIDGLVELQKCMTGGIIPRQETTQ